MRRVHVAAMGDEIKVIFFKISMTEVVSVFMSVAIGIR